MKNPITPWLQKLLQVAGYVALAFLGLWAFGALWFWDVLPLVISRFLALGWLVLVIWLFFGVPGRRGGLCDPPMPVTGAIWSTLAGIVMIAILWSWKTPSAVRDWQPAHARNPVVSYDGGQVTIENFRNFTYRSMEDFDVNWETRTYSLNEIQSLDIFIEPFSEFRGISHFFLSFGFANGEHVAVSVAARIEQDENFGLLPSIFKEFELLYSVGDERDLVHRRVNHQKHDVYLYPIAVDHVEELRAFFVLTMNHATALEKHPKFYNGATQNCTNTVLQHVEYLSATELPWWDYRLNLPGFLDDFLYEKGVIATSVPLEELREQARINDRAPDPAGMTSAEWSAMIREGIPRPMVANQ